MKIYLIRHGLTDYNVKLICQGISDIDLNDIGIQQALSVKPYINKLNIKHVYSGELIRQKHTGQLVTQDINVDFNVLDNFNEINFGEFDGTEWSYAFPEINRRLGSNIKNYKENSLIEIGDCFYSADHSGKAESCDMVADRFEKGINLLFDKYANCDGNILVASSGTSIGSFIYKKCSYFTEYTMNHCCITEITRENGVFKAISIFDGLEK